MQQYFLLHVVDVLTRVTSKCASEPVLAPQMKKKWLLYFRDFLGRTRQRYTVDSLKGNASSKCIFLMLKHRHTQENYFCAVQWAIFQLWRPITVNWTLEMKQTCVRASTSVYNGAFVYVNVHMCCVVNLCQLCVAVPLTSDRCVGADASCWLGIGGGGLPEGL